MSGWRRGPVWAGDFTGDLAGAGVVAEELQAVGAVPQVGAGVEHGVGPVGAGVAVGLEPVVLPAQGGEVAGAGGAAVAVGVDVVAVGEDGGAGAPGEDTGVAESRQSRDTVCVSGLGQYLVELLGGGPEPMSFAWSGVEFGGDVVEHAGAVEREIAALG